MGVISILMPRVPPVWLIVGELHGVSEELTRAGKIGVTSVWKDRQTFDVAQPSAVPKRGRRNRPFAAGKTAGE